MKIGLLSDIHAHRHDQAQEISDLLLHINASPKPDYWFSPEISRIALRKTEDSSMGSNWIVRAAGYRAITTSG